MISNSLTSSEDEVLKHFRERAIQLVCVIATHTRKISQYSNLPGQELNQPPEIIPGEELNQSAETTSGARLKLEAEFRDYIIQVLTMMNVIALQTKYLERLRQIFLNSYPELDHRPQWNEFDIPLMSGHPEQMRSVMKSITAIVAEREKFYKELKNLTKEFETLRTLVGFPPRVFGWRDGGAINKSNTMVVSTTEPSGESNNRTRLIGETRTDYHCIYVRDECIHAPRVLD